MKIEQDIPLVLALDDASVTLEQVGGKGVSLARADNRDAGVRCVWYGLIYV